MKPSTKPRFGILSAVALAIILIMGTAPEAFAQGRGAQGGGNRGGARMHSGGARGGGAFRGSGFRSGSPRMQGSRSFRSAGRPQSSGFRSVGRPQSSGFRSVTPRTQTGRSFRSAAPRSTRPSTAFRSSGSPGSRSVAAPRAFGVQRGGLGVTGARPSQRPTQYRNTYRPGNSNRAGDGSRALTGFNRPRSSNSGFNRAGSSAFRGHARGDARQGLRGGTSRSSFRSGTHGIQRGHAFRHDRHADGHKGRHHGHHGFGHRNHHGHAHHTGYVPGIHVHNGFCRTGFGNSIIGCGPTFGFPYGYGYPYSIYGGSLWRYPIYNTYGAYAYSYDDYPADVFEPLSVEPTLDGDEQEIAEEAWEERMNSELESRALDDFGERYGDAPPAPSVTGMSPEATETARELGTLLGRGDQAFEAGEYDKAREEYVRALVLAGEDSSARIALGLAEYALGSYGDASQAIRKGVARAPTLANSDFDLRSVYGNAQDFDAHRRMLADHVSSHPEDADAAFLLGFVEYFSGDREIGKSRLTGYLADPGHDESVREFVHTAAVSAPRQ